MIDLRGAVRLVGTGLESARSWLRAPGTPPGAQVDNFIIYGAYGDVMHQFQVFELTLWGFLTRSIKERTTLDQAMQKVEKWDGTTLGSLVRGLKNQDHWPAGVVDEMEGAVDARNYLAHHFLREYFLLAPNDPAQEEALEQLATISNRLTRLERVLEDHLKSLGVPNISELSDEERAELDELRPTRWLDSESN